VIYVSLVIYVSRDLRLSRLADAMLAAHVGDLQAGVGFLEDRHNLALREFALLHGSVSVVPARILYFQPVSRQGKLTRASAAARSGEWMGTAAKSA
jgi:hypothetical protein